MIVAVGLPGSTARGRGGGKRGGGTQSEAYCHVLSIVRSYQWLHLFTPGGGGGVQVLMELDAAMGPSATIVHDQDRGPLRCRTAADQERGRRKTRQLKVGSRTGMLTNCTKHTVWTVCCKKWRPTCSSREYCARLNTSRRNERKYRSPRDRCATDGDLSTDKNNNTTIPHIKTEAATRTTHKR